MSFVPQETDPLLDNAERPSRTQNPPRPGDPNVSRSRSHETSSDLDSDDERMGTWGTKEKRGKKRMIVDNVGLGMIAVSSFCCLGATTRPADVYVIRLDSSDCSCSCRWCSTSFSRLTARIPRVPAGSSSILPCRAWRSPWPSSVSRPDRRLDTLVPARLITLRHV